MTSRSRALACSALALLAAACATPAPRVEAPVFFPPAPAPPRIQYLTSFRGVRDVAAQSSFDRFVVGEREDLHLDKPYGVAIDGGRIYVCDTNAGMVVFDLKAGAYGGMKGAVGPGALVQPLNISIDSDHTRYIADPERGQVVAFDAEDRFLRAYGEPGGWRPVDAAPWGDRLYVADPANGLVKVFDKGSGQPVGRIGDQGEPAERLDRPTNLAFDPDGNLYVTDVGRFQVVQFDREGRFRKTVGQAGDNFGHFARPKGIAIDREGRLYAVDASFNNVQVFNKDGRLLMFFGEGGEAPGTFLLPAKVAIDYDDVEYFRQFANPGFQIEYLVLVTSQFGPRPVSVLAYGREEGRSYPTDDELLKAIDERRRKEQEQRPAP